MTPYGNTEPRQDIASRLSSLCSPWPGTGPLLQDDLKYAGLIIHSISTNGRAVRKIEDDLRYRLLGNGIDAAWVLRRNSQQQAPRFLSYTQKGTYEMLEATLIGGVTLDQ